MSKNTPITPLTLDEYWKLPEQEQWEKRHMLKGLEDFQYILDTDMRYRRAIKNWFDYKRRCEEEMKKYGRGALSFYHEQYVGEMVAEIRECEKILGIKLSII